jgi:HAD superfamily hydrolase (TIGR01490 family)
MAARSAAFFDLDNTMVRGSTLYFLGRAMYQRGFFTKADISKFVVANVRFRLTGTEKPEVIERFQKAATDFIGGHEVNEIYTIAQSVYDEYVSPALIQGTIEIAKKHLAEGNEVWLVTAAPEDMAKLIADRLGFTGAIGTKVAIEDGKYLGHLNGKILHGVEKARAVRELAAERGFSLNNCHAYSDSASDFPLLQSVGTPHAINPDARLRIKALAEKWEIVDFRKFRKLNRWLGPTVSRFVALGAWLTPRSRGDKKGD